MTAHSHATRVPGCHRCEMSAAELGTPDDFADVRERVEAATPGPWKNVAGYVWAEDCTVNVAVTRSPTWIQGVNGEFIAQARTDIPRLLEALDEANAEIESLRTRVLGLYDGLNVDREIIRELTTERDAARAEAERVRPVAEQAITAIGLRSHPHGWDGVRCEACDVAEAETKRLRRLLDGGGE